MPHMNQPNGLFAEMAPLSQMVSYVRKQMQN